ncbi:AAA family ATPase [Virgibacillus sp. MG-45]|uniref:AAA family ATPase n=1 Tax=Virgibacillus sp. MG-45 TaxID=3102791 RepID=UPI002EDB6233
MTNIPDIALDKILTPKENKISNKQIIVSKIKGIRVNKFRNMQDKLFTLSDRVTLFSGHNGTMKSTLIGLFVQPFNSDVVDLYNNPLKTQFSSIFKLSPEYDKEKYEYDVFIEDIDGFDYRIPVYTKPRSKDNPNIRIVTGGNSKYDGNLIYNTSYLNLNRLYSIQSSNASPDPIYLSEDEKVFISRFYNAILLKQSYKQMETIRDKTLKQTFGPTNSTYNYESISSGEDNLGRIVHSLIAFMRIAKENKSSTYNGILCIDEVEASLHPVAQINLFNFLYKWSGKYRVQILLNSHSLSVIKNASDMAKKGKLITTYYLSTLYSSNIDVLYNPAYESIYKELTFEYTGKNELPKIDIICEDKLAERFIRYMVSKQDIIRRINFIAHDQSEGFPFMFLIKLSNNASSVLSDAIIILDADVPDAAISKIIKKDKFIQLPNKALKLPIEKLLVRYLWLKEVDDQIFTKKLKQPRESIINSLIQSNINIRSEDDIKNIEVKHFKKWVKDNDDIVKKVFNAFSKDVEGREEFVDELVKKLNKIFNVNGYPLINYNK